MDAETQTPEITEAATTYASPRRFSVNVVLTLGTRLLMLASTLSTSIIVARWLGAEGVGSLAVINVTIALAVQLGCAGLPSANTYFIAQDRSKLATIWTNALSFGFLAGIILAAGIIVAARLRGSLFSNVPASLITVAALSIPFQLITVLGTNVFLGIAQIDRLNVMDAVGTLLLLLNAVTVLIVLGLGLFALVSFNTLTTVIVCSIVTVLIVSTVRKTGVKGTRFDARMFGRMMRYGIKFHVATMAGLLILRADLLIVNHFRGPREAGVYAVASQMGSLLLLLPAIIGTLLFPWVASEPDPRGGMTMRATRHTAFVMLFACAAAVPLSFAMPLVYGAVFSNATIQLLILLPGVYLLGIESVMVQHFSGTGLPVAIPIFWIVALICNLALNFILIPSFGAIAAAGISTFTYALVFGLVAAYFRLKTGSRLSAALLLRGDEFRDLFSPNKLGFFLR